MAEPRRRKVDIELEHLRTFFEEPTIREAFEDSTFLNPSLFDGETTIDVAIRAMRHLSQLTIQQRFNAVLAVQRSEQLGARNQQLQDEIDRRNATAAASEPSYLPEVEHSPWLPWIWVTALLAPLLWTGLAISMLRAHPEWITQPVQPPSGVSTIQK